MTLFPVFRKNFIATDALFPYLTASVPLFLAYNRLEIAFHIVLHKIHLHAVVFQLTRNDERINRISCKTAYFTRYDQVEFLLFCILYHLQKRRSFLRLRARDSFVDILF